MKFNILSIKEKADENNAKLFIVLVPAKPDIDIYFENNKKYPKLTKQLKKFTDQNNIGFVDILTSLSIKQNDTEDLYLRRSSK